MEHNQSSANCRQRTSSVSELDDVICADLLEAVLELQKYPDCSTDIIPNADEWYNEKDVMDEKCVLNQEEMLQMERTTLSVVSNVFSDPSTNYSSVETSSRPHAQSSRSPSTIWQFDPSRRFYEKIRTISPSPNIHGGAMSSYNARSRPNMSETYQLPVVPAISSYQDGFSCYPSLTPSRTSSQYLAPSGIQMNDMKHRLSMEGNRLPLEASQSKSVPALECVERSSVKSHLEEKYTNKKDTEVTTSNGIPASALDNSDLSPSIQQPNALNVSSSHVGEERRAGFVSAPEADASNRELDSNFQESTRSQRFLEGICNMALPVDSIFSSISKDAYQSPSFAKDTGEHEKQETKASEEYASSSSPNTVNMPLGSFNSSYFPNTDDEIKCSRLRSCSIPLQIDPSVAMSGQLSNENYQSGSQRVSSAIRDTSSASENKTKSAGASNSPMDVALDSQNPRTYTENAFEQREQALLMSVLSEEQVRLIKQNRILLFPEETEKYPLLPVERCARYKTEECVSFQQSHACPYGIGCQFAHGSEELRVAHRHPSYKTRTCKNFSRNGTCRYGLQCNFLHGWDDPQRPRKARKRIDSENDA